MTLGVALGGGFARGIAHIGALKVLEEENIRVDYVAGTSVGAIIGALYCAGMTPAELEEMARTLRFSDFARWTLSHYGFYNSDRMVRLFARMLRKHTFEELVVPLAITATDFRTGEAVVFTKGELVDPIRASCAYPGMFLPVEIGGRSYVDGMLAYGVPTTPLRRMGADRVMGIHLSSRWDEERTPPPRLRSNRAVLLDRTIEAVRVVREGRGPGDRAGRRRLQLRLLRKGARVDCRRRSCHARGFAAVAGDVEPSEVCIAEDWVRTRYRATDASTGQPGRLMCFAEIEHCGLLRTGVL